MTKRVCRCPRKESLDGMRADAIWASKACALRWSRENPGEPLPGRGNAHIIDTRSRSGLKVSYRKAVIEVAYLISVESHMSHEEAEALAEMTLSRALPTRQREQLAQRSNERRAA
jgi:hypothetical protein